MEHILLFFLYIVIKLSDEEQIYLEMCLIPALQPQNKDLVGHYKADSLLSALFVPSLPRAGCPVVRGIATVSYAVLLVLSSSAHPGPVENCGPSRHGRSEEGGAAVEGDLFLPYLTPWLEAFGGSAHL